MLAKSAQALEGVSLQRDGRCEAGEEAEEIKKKSVRRIERKGRSNPVEPWWVSETLVKDCENAWLEPC